MGAEIQGRVLSRDGQPLLLDGIGVECLNDGVTVTTEEDGSFTLEVPSGVIVRVRFTDPLDAGAIPGLPICHENGDYTPDDGDVEDDVVELAPLADGDVCVIEIEIAGGRIVECDVDLPSFPGNGGPNFHGEGVLVPLAPPGATTLSGEVEIEANSDDCATLEIEAEGLEPGVLYGVILVSPLGEQATPGALVPDATGAAHLSLLGCAGPGLPFDVARLTDLAGYGVIVVDGDGVPVLVGQIPGRGHEFGEPGSGGGELPDLPPIPGFPGDVPTIPDYDDLLDLLDDLLGGGGGVPGFGGFPGFGG
jgi:hypothetical protein